MILPLLISCAAQTSYGLLDDARAKVAEAKKARPNDPQVARAEISLEAGEDQLREAKYGKAEHSFLNAIQISDRVIKGNEAIASNAEPEPLPQLSPEELAAASQPSAQETAQKLDRMSLPKEALAKYLADKRKGGATMTPPKSTPSTRPATPVAAAPLPAPEPVRKPEPESKPEPAVEKVAEKPAEKSAEKPIPLVKAEKIPPMGTGEELGGDEPIELEPLKRVLKGKVSFESNLSKLSDNSMSQLDGLAQFLIENPSNTLLITPTLGANEMENLSLDRFQQVFDYLKARGVPDDQVRLDSAKKMGTTASLELFLIDH